MGPRCNLGTQVNPYTYLQLSLRTENLKLLSHFRLSRQHELGVSMILVLQRNHVQDIDAYNKRSRLDIAEVPRGLVVLTIFV